MTFSDVIYGLKGRNTNIQLKLDALTFDEKCQMILSYSNFIDILSDGMEYSNNITNLVHNP